MGWTWAARAGSSAASGATALTCSCATHSVVERPNVASARALGPEERRSHGEVALYELVIQLRHLALSHRTTAIHNHEALPNAAREGKLLLDEQDGQLFLL